MYSFFSSVSELCILEIGGQINNDKKIVGPRVKGWQNTILEQSKQYNVQEST